MVYCVFFGVIGTVGQNQEFGANLRPKGCFRQGATTVAIESKVKVLLPPVRDRTG